MLNRRHRVWKNGRLVFYESSADSELWDNYWANRISTEYYKAYEAGNLDEYPFFDFYLSKTDRILEAGCGTARYIVALRARGFLNVEGIDFGQKTIDSIKAIYPDLPVKFGDAMRVDAEDNTFDGYISLGVVEHREEGPEPFLTEACRILKPGGYAFISVPYINILRNLKQKMGFYPRENKSGKDFYQYAYSKPEFSKKLKNAGFEIVKMHGIAGSYGFRDEFLGFFRMLDRLPGSWIINRFLKNFDRIDSLGHMILFICRKIA